MANTLFIDLKYISLISNRLRNYLYKGNGRSSFTHHCERVDSNKRRAYFLPFKGSILLKCHHCGVSTSLGKFIREVDPQMYSEYRLEVFRESLSGASELKVPENINKPPAKVAEFNGLISYSDIARSNPARLYLDRRQIPEDKINLFYLAPKFFQWARQYEDSFSKFKEG